MTVVVCIDTRRGMMFSGRRQSTDSVLRRRVIELAKGRDLVMDGYSESQFRCDGADIVVMNDPFLYEKDCVIFAEDTDTAPYADRIDRLVIYRWNRIYPRDAVLTLDPFGAGMRLESILDFEGSSHSRITEEIWVKRDRTEDGNE